MDQKADLKAVNAVVWQEESFKGSLSFKVDVCMYNTERQAEFSCIKIDLII